MPVSKKPRQAKKDDRGPNPFTPAGTLLYGLYEAAMFRLHAMRRERIEEVTAQPRGRRSKSGHWLPANAESREARRRVRQGAHLHQHPSVVARFANHPTRAQIEEEVRQVEAKSGLVAKAKRALSPRRKREAVA